MTQLFAFFSNDVFVEKTRPCCIPVQEELIQNYTFWNLFFQVFKFELDERKIYKKKNTSRPENVSRCFPLKLSVTSGLLNLPQATCKTFNIRKGWQLLAYLTFARKGCAVLFIVLKYGDDKVESYVFAKRCRHLWNIL